MSHFITLTINKRRFHLDERGSEGQGFKKLHVNLCDCCQASFVSVNNRCHILCVK